MSVSNFKVMSISKGLHRSETLVPNEERYPNGSMEVRDSTTKKGGYWRIFTAKNPPDDGSREKWMVRCNMSYTHRYLPVGSEIRDSESNSKLVKVDNVGWVVYPSYTVNELIQMLQYSAHSLVRTPAPNFPDPVPDHLPLEVTISNDETSVLFVKFRSSERIISDVAINSGSSSTFEILAPFDSIMARYPLEPPYYYSYKPDSLLRNVKADKFSIRFRSPSTS